MCPERVVQPTPAQAIEAVQTAVALPHPAGVPLPAEWQPRPAPDLEALPLFASRRDLGTSLFGRLRSGRFWTFAERSSDGAKRNPDSRPFDGLSATAGVPFPPFILHRISCLFIIVCKRPF